MRRRTTNMPSILILGALVAILGTLAYVRGGWQLPAEGLQTGFSLLLQVAPQLVLGFALAGLVTVLLPRELLGRLVGADSGLPGILIATAAGIATPGGPFLQFPLVAALAGSGAGIGPIGAYLTAWSLLGWNRILIYEVPLLGAPFAVSRFLVSLAIPILVGLLFPTVLRFFDRPAGP